MTETQSLMAAQNNRKPPPDFLKDLDWNAFEAAAIPLAQLYNPPQLVSSCTGFAARLSMCWNSLFTHRAPICAKPVIPCCCAKAVQSRISDLAAVKLSDPDDWFVKMLSVEHPNTPEFLKGLFWMEDNYAPEVLLTFQDMDWVSGKQGYFMPKYSWTNDPSCIGTACLCINFSGSPASAWPFTHQTTGGSTSTRNGSTGLQRARRSLDQMVLLWRWQQRTWFESVLTIRVIRHQE
ncbi:unnamed protein product [Symbiodinium necroappetens]|uniref:Uncharacterized protein n=1 Tax=Symbiodinium necroappetens TaxID=1628268 RepID=A0A812LK59_9DINO|nr:unnamed protein product [Symbiodinium necroappetens]